MGYRTLNLLVFLLPIAIVSSVVVSPWVWTSDDWLRVLLLYPSIIVGSAFAAGVYCLVGWAIARILIRKPLTFRHPFVSFLMGAVTILTPRILAPSSTGAGVVYVLALSPLVAIIYKVSSGAEREHKPQSRIPTFRVALAVLVASTLVAYCSHPILAYTRDHLYTNVEVVNPAYVRICPVYPAIRYREHPETFMHELRMYQVRGEDIIDLRHIFCSSAEMTLDTELGRWLVTARLTADGRQNLRLWSRRNVDMLYGLFLGSELCEVKSVESVVKTDEIIIPQSSQQDADRVVRAIRRGGVLE